MDRLLESAGIFGFIAIVCLLGILSQKGFFPAFERSVEVRSVEVRSGQIVLGPTDAEERGRVRAYRRSSWFNYNDPDNGFAESAFRSETHIDSLSPRRVDEAALPAYLRSGFERRFLAHTGYYGFVGPKRSPTLSPSYVFVTRALDPDSRSNPYHRYPESIRDPLEFGLERELYNQRESWEALTCRPIFGSRSLWSSVRMTYSPREYTSRKAADRLFAFLDGGANSQLLH